MPVDGLTELLLPVWKGSERDFDMSTAVEPAEVPTEFGRNLAACVNCRLVKTFDQACFSFESVSE